MAEVADLLRDREELDENAEYVEGVEAFCGTDRLNATAALRDREIPDDVEVCEVRNGELVCETDVDSNEISYDDDVEVFDVNTLESNEIRETENVVEFCGTEKLNAGVAERDADVDNDIEIMV